MSSYTTSIKRKVSTALDNAGTILNLPRLEDELLVDYRERLIDHVKNRGNATTDGLNYSFAREAGEQRKHVLTIEPTADNDFPFIEITSKYLRLKDSDTLDSEYDLYSYTIGELYTAIGTDSTKFTVTYYDSDYANENATKLFYGNNLKFKQIEQLGSSKLNRLENKYVKSVIFSSTNHRYKKATIAEVVDTFDYYIDYQEGLIYTGQNSSDIINYLYYKVPYRIYYSPVVFFPLNDQDIDEIIKDTLFVEDGSEHKVLNSKGAEWINELLAEHPLTWGE